MSVQSIKPLDAASLRDAGREPETPFGVMLTDGSTVIVHRQLRVLPGKRIVGEGEWHGLRVLAKFFVASGSARHWGKEKKGIDALHQAGVETPELRLAAPLPTGGHVLLTDFIEGAQSLAEAWGLVSELAAGSGAALAVLRPAFHLLGRLHASGLVQDDLHLGNFLRCGERVFIIDGDAVRAISPGKPLDESPAIGNLAILLAQLPQAWDDAWSDVLAAYGVGGGRYIQDMSRLQNEVVGVRAWRLNDYLGKTVRDCTLFAVQRHTFRFTAVRRDEASRLATLLESPDEPIVQGRLLKDGRTCTVAQIGEGECSLVIKRYNLKNLRHRFERLWRPSRAWHSWREGHRLRFLGIPTPEPLALIEERVGPLRRRAFLINAYCPGDNLLKLLAPDQVPADDVAEALLSLFHALYRLRISHGDLKATNLLWHEGRVVVIDLDALVQHRSANSHRRAWRRDRARFMRNWPRSSALFQWLDRNLPSSD